jgi:hypothetical protein
MNNFTMSDIDKQDIPSMADQLSAVQTEECFTELSFAVATTLAVAKRMTWEQTPWLSAKLEHSKCEQIASILSAHLKQDISREAIRFAVLLSATYENSQHDLPLEAYPQIFIVFPHLKRDVSRDEHFLKIWHDIIVRPAFMRAWEDSCLVKAYGANKDSTFRIKLPFCGTYHVREAFPAENLFNHLRAGSTHRVRDHWPVLQDLSDPGEDPRAQIFDDAWKSIKGMLENHPDMHEFQNPFLLVMDSGRLDVNPNLSMKDIYKEVGVRWDKYIDSRYVDLKTFKVSVETVLGTWNAVEKECEEEEGDVGCGKTNRVAEETADGVGHRKKRVRTT